MNSNVAQRIATFAHKDQLDKIGEPYIAHPQRVAASVKQAGYPDRVVAAAWLHDVVEDTHVTLQTLRAAGFREDVVDAVDALSKRPHEPLVNYYSRVKANPIATVVKWWDVQDNSDPERLARVAPDVQARLRSKYERAKQELMNFVPKPEEV